MKQPTDTNKYIVYPIGSGMFGLMLYNWSIWAVVIYCMLLGLAIAYFTGEKENT